LGESEKEFRERLFKPVTDGAAAPTAYGSWLCLFAASLCWRALHLYYEKGWISNISGPRTAVVTNSLKRWSTGIRRSEIDFACRDFHFIPSGTMEEMQGLDPPPNINRYLSRYVQIDVATGDDQAFVYAKLGPAILLGFLQHPAEAQWPDTAIDPRGGTFPRQLELPGRFADYLFDHARSVLRSQRSISEQQGRSIGEAYRSNIARAADSGTLASLAADVEMFGRDAVFRGQLESGLGSDPDRDKA